MHILLNLAYAAAAAVVFMVFLHATVRIASRAWHRSRIEVESEAWQLRKTRLTDPLKGNTLHGS